VGIPEYLSHSLPPIVPLMVFSPLLVQVKADPQFKKGRSYLVKKEARVIYFRIDDFFKE